MNLWRRVPAWWLLANAFGIGMFLYLAAQAWVEPGTVPLGEAFVWGATALPILAGFFLLHLVTGGMALAARNRNWLLASALTGSSWLAAFFFDNAHHGGI